MKFSKKRKTLLFIICSLFAFTLSLNQYYRRWYRPDLTVYGPVNMADGIGRQTVELIDCLKNDYSITFKRLDGEINHQDVPPSVVKILEKKKYKNGKVIIYEGVLFPSASRYLYDNFKDAHRCIKIAYSMVESTSVPDFYVFNLNTFFDAVCVPDPFLAQVYKDSGVTIPIFVLPLGINLQPFLSEPLKSAPSTPFVFANFSAFIERKNHRLLIEAFHEAFGNDPNVKLWINGRYSYNLCYENLDAYVKSLNVSNISITQNIYTNLEYLNNFKNIDCYVSISQSEGFSIQPREAMALGIPVILSNNTAQTTIAKSQKTLAINSTKEIPAFYEIFKNTYGKRYDVDKDDVIEAFKKMKKDYNTYLLQNAESREFAKKYDFSELSSFYKTLVRPKKVILSENNEIKEGALYTSSKTLFEKYRSL